MEDDLSIIADSARALYDRGLYSAALEKYEALIQSEVHESQLYLNIGNCYTRLGELGEAKVYFERALLHNPVNESARHNLNWINLRITESILEPQEELIHWVSGGARSFLLPEYWIILSWFFILVTLFMLILRRTRMDGLTWRWPFATTALAAAFIIIAQVSVPSSQLAIVTKRNSVGCSEPSNDSNQILILNEGSSGIVIKEEHNWSCIKFSNGQLAWFSKNDWEMVLPKTN